MLTTLKYKIFIDKRLNEVNTKNIFKALERVCDDYNNLIKLESLDDKSIKKLCDEKISKNYVLLTEDEELLRRWQVSGGKAFYLDNKKNKCYPDIDKLIITNSPKKELEDIKNSKDMEVEEIYKFILKCLHIYN